MAELPVHVVDPCAKALETCRFDRTVPAYSTAVHKRCPVSRASEPDRSSDNSSRSHTLGFRLTGRTPRTEPKQGAYSLTRRSEEAQCDRFQLPAAPVDDLQR